MTIAGDGGMAENPQSTEPEASQVQSDKPKDEGMFSQENVAKDTKVPLDEVSAEEPIGTANIPKDIVITAEDKVAFIDSVVGNTRFEREYVLFGGKLKVSVRSLTVEETNALSAFAFRQSAKDPTWHLSGRARKYLLSAQVSMLNGTAIPPLEEPLFETLDKDGKSTLEPGWVSKASFWDDKSAALIDAVLSCISDFDRRYSMLCSKAEDENFWAPDTP